MALELPWRYGFEFTSRLALGPLTFNLSLPLFSDPFFQQDFLNRSEDMDWLRFLKQEDNPALRPSAASFVDKIDGQLSVPSTFYLGGFPVFPYPALALPCPGYPRKRRPRPASGTRSTLFSVDPAREFFYPEQWTSWTLRPVWAEPCCGIHPCPHCSPSRQTPAGESPVGQAGEQAKACRRSPGQPPLPYCLKWRNPGRWILPPERSGTELPTASWLRPCFHPKNRVHVPSDSLPVMAACTKLRWDRRFNTRRLGRTSRISIFQRLCTSCGASVPPARLL
jgi:hypothetical protein